MLDSNTEHDPEPEVEPDPEPEPEPAVSELTDDTETVLYEDDEENGATHG